MICPKCGSPMKKENKDYNLKGIIVNNIEADICTNPKCGNILLTEEAMEKIAEEYKVQSEMTDNERIRDYINSLKLVSFVDVIRKSKKLTRPDIGIRLDLAPQRIYEIERGTSNISLRTAFELEIALNEDIHNLFKMLPPEEIEKLKEGTIIREKKKKRK